MALAGHTEGGLRKFRGVEASGRVWLAAPASPFDRDDFDRGCRELERLGLGPAYDETVFEPGPIVAGSAEHRAKALIEGWRRLDIQAVMAVRGGYGSMELLPLLDPDPVRAHPKPFVGYSDTTALHSWLNGHVGVTSVHGGMLHGRLSAGESAYDLSTFVTSLTSTPLGELSPDGIEVLRGGEATGPLVGGTLATLCASLGTPFDFRPPIGAVVFIEDVGERPYRLRRSLEQLRQSGRLARASALVFGEFCQCDEPSGRVTARMVIEEFVGDVAMPVLWGLPAGHTTRPMLTLPFGVNVRVVADGQPRLVFDEAAAE